MFSPLLVPTYGMVLALTITVLSFLPTGIKLSVLGVSFLTTCVIPIITIVALWRLHYISSPRLTERRERIWPYGITVVSYLCCAYWLWRANAPMWLWGFPAGGALALAAIVAISFRWKISAHSAGMGGLCAEMMAIATSNVAVGDNMLLWFAAAVVLAGCVMTSRLLLERHTLWQTLAGFALGFVCVAVF